MYVLLLTLCYITSGSGGSIVSSTVSFLINIILRSSFHSGSYNALKVDVWSLGATVWEMAEAVPPFADTRQIGDRWPTLSKPEIYSPAFHDFLQQCSEPAATRPNPSELTKVSVLFR